MRRIWLLAALLAAAALAGCTAESFADAAGSDAEAGAVVTGGDCTGGETIVCHVEIRNDGPAGTFAVTATATRNGEEVDMASTTVELDRGETTSVPLDGIYVSGGRDTVEFSFDVSPL